jgi:hypothetical protein
VADGDGDALADTRPVAGSASATVGSGRLPTFHPAASIAADAPATKTILEHFTAAPLPRELLGVYGLARHAMSASVRRDLRGPQGGSAHEHVARLQTRNDLGERLRTLRGTPALRSRADNLVQSYTPLGGEGPDLLE